MKTLLFLQFAINTVLMGQALGIALVWATCKAAPPYERTQGRAFFSLAAVVFSLMMSSLANSL